jgi:hypothetical protein
MLTFINKYDLICPEQFGFRAGRSTEDALLAISAHVCNSLNVKKDVFTLYIDISKAFDSLNDEILFYASYNIMGFVVLC